jgi:single-stranded-DNA-specific exonuclease
MNQNLTTLMTKAVAMVTSLPPTTRIRVVSHYDADGITSAGILCTALYRKGYDFHATLMRNPFTKGLERLNAEHNDLIIFSDMGSASIEMIEQMDSPCIILDHHQGLKEKTVDSVLQINANLCGIDGTYEASAIHSPIPLTTVMLIYSPLHFLEPSAINSTSAA